LLRKAYESVAHKLLSVYSNKLNERYRYLHSPNNAERFSEIPLFINSWQAICIESELSPKKIISKNIMGENIVVWKTDHNRISVMDAYCPHFGVHLGSGGVIVEDVIVCPFHHRKFDADGHCRGKGMKNIYSYPVRVNAGIVFAWFDSEKNPPSWELPNLEIDLDGECWRTMNTKLQGIAVGAHPMTYIENGVDFSHAEALHGLRQEDTSMKAKEETLSVFFRHAEEKRGYFNIQAYGPFVVDYKVSFTWWKRSCFRFLVLLQLMPDKTFIAHKIEMKHKTPVNSFLVRMLHAGIFIYFEFKLLKTFMKEDHMIMINRKHLEAPDYGEQDSYAKDFRVWYKQFY